MSLVEDSLCYVLEQVKTLYPCMLGNLSCFCCRLLTFFQINFFKIFFQEHYQSVKQFGYRSGLTFCRAVAQLVEC